MPRNSRDRSDKRIRLYSVPRLFHVVALLFVLVLATVWAFPFGLGRRLLWLTIETCRLDARLLNSPAPCLVVTKNNGIDPDYVIVRSPLDRSHTILAPTARIVGIEAPQLRRPNAPNYVADAWANRRFSFPEDVPNVPTNDIGLAINSQRGRTQDQLHIHVDCVLADVKARLATTGPRLQPGRWSPITLVDGEPPYWATALPGGLDRWNVIDLAASFLKVSDKEMPILTLAVFATRNTSDDPGFVLVARRDFYRQHAELLLDHDCAKYRRRMRSIGAP